MRKGKGVADRDYRGLSGFLVRTKIFFFKYKATTTPQGDQENISGVTSQ